MQVGSKFVLEPRQLNQLFDALRNRGYSVVGPVVRDRAIVYDDLSSTSDLPAGWTDEQDGGTYRLKKRSDQSLFGFAVGPQSWKRFLLQPEMTLWRARRDGSWLKSAINSEQAPKYAFIGVRSCELHAIATQDKVFVSGEYADPSYKARRENLFVVAVNCVQAGGTCFCASMGTGPNATFGFDLALTEALDSRNHYFLAEVGSKVGAGVLSEVTRKEARENEIETAEQLVKDCANRMGRTMETKGIKDLLYRNYNNARWDDVSDRCLTCGNCTMVCPTCFCTTVEDYSDLSGGAVERQRRMDVCFTMDFSYIHGGSIRASPRSRYRQWMTHKLATWIDQFGISGCVGCGRCITWCPVAIDITEEARAIRQSEAGGAEPTPAVR